MKAYVVKSTAVLNYFNPGQQLFEYTGEDCGFKKNHEKCTGLKHINVSINGDVPFITMARNELDAVIVENKTYEECQKKSTRSR